MCAWIPSLPKRLKDDNPTASLPERQWRVICLGLTALLLCGLGAAAYADSPSRFPAFHRHELRSEILGENREIYVRVPRGYKESTDPYSVLYVLDAEWHMLQAVAAVEQHAECGYIQSHSAPPMVVVVSSMWTGIETILPPMRPSSIEWPFPRAGRPTVS